MLKSPTDVEILVFRTRSLRVIVSSATNGRSVDSNQHYRWYQRPPNDSQVLPGLGRERNDFANEIFPESLHGQSVLDVGCAEGVFCAEAIRRGAARVVGVDKKERRVSMANQIQASQSGASKAEFIYGNFEDMPLAELGQFDCVICLNVIHHATNPIEFIQRLASVTRRKLILEVAGLEELEARTSLGAWRHVFSMIPLKLQPPVIVCGANAGFCLTPKAVTQALQNVGDPGFGSIEIRSSFVSEKKTRYCLIASRSVVNG